jgi:hypothetical protein
MPRTNYRRPHSQVQAGSQRNFRVIQANPSVQDQTDKEIVDFTEKNFWLLEHERSSDFFDNFKQIIDSYPFEKKITAIQELISYLDKGSKNPLSTATYCACGAFFTDKILTPECINLQSLPPKAASKRLVFLFLQLRSMMDFRRGALFSDRQEDSDSSLLDILMTLAKGHSLFDIRQPLLFISKRGDAVGDFLKELFFKGRLAGHLVIGSTPHPALDLGAFAFHLMDEETAFEWIIKLETEERASYTKAFILPIDRPDALLTLLKEKIVGDKASELMLDEVIRNYDEMLNNQTREEKERHDEQLARLRAVRQTFLPRPVHLQSLDLSDAPKQNPDVLPDYSPYMPRQLTTLLKPLPLLPNDTEPQPNPSTEMSDSSILPSPLQPQHPQPCDPSPLSYVLPDFSTNTLEPLAPPTILHQMMRNNIAEMADLAQEGVKFIIQQIQGGHHKAWENCLAAFEKLQQLLPAQAESDKETIALALLNHAWSNELSIFLRTYFADISDPFWGKITQPQEGKVEKTLSNWIFLINLFNPEIEAEKSFYMHVMKSLISQLPHLKKVTFTVEEGRKAALLCELLSSAIGKFITAGDFLNFLITFSSHVVKSRKAKRSVFECIDPSSSFFTYALKFLHSQQMPLDASRLGSFYVTLEKICRMRKSLNKEEEKWAVDLLSRFAESFRCLTLTEETLTIICDNYNNCRRLFISTPLIRNLIENNAELDNSIEITYNYFLIELLKIIHKPNFDQLADHYPNLFLRPAYLLNDSHPLRTKVCQISVDFLHLLLKNVNSRKESEILGDLLLYIFAFKLTPINLVEIVQKLLENPTPERTYAVLQIARRFVPLKEFSFEDLYSIILPALLEKGKKEETYEEWKTDLFKLCNLFHEYFYVDREKETKSKTKKVLNKITESFFSLVENDEASTTLITDSLNILRFGRGFSPSNHTKYLPHLYQRCAKALEAGGDQASWQNVMGLILGRSAYLYLFGKKNDSETMGTQFDESAIDQLNIFKAGIQKIFQKQKEIPELRFDVLPRAITFTHCFGIYLAHLSFKNPKKCKEKIDSVCWDRFSFDPAVKKYLTVSPNHDSLFFNNIYDQAHLCFGMALLNLRPTVESFLKSQKIFQSVLAGGLNPENGHLAMHLHKMLIKTICEIPRQKIQKEDRKKYLISLFIDPRFLKYIKKKDIYLLYAFEFLTKKESEFFAEEMSFSLWNVLQNKIDPLHSKILLDNWLKLAKEFRSAEFCDKISALYAEL